MDNYRDLLGKAGVLFDEAKAILGNPDSPGEDTERVEGLLQEAQELKTRGLQLKDIMDHSAEIVDREEKQQDSEEQKETRQSAKKFGDWGEFLQAVYRANSTKSHDPRLQWFKDEDKGGHEEKTMTENVGAAGGFLVPAEFDATLRGVMGESSIVRQRATIIRMRRRQIDIPVLDQTSTTADIPHWFGGMQFYWTEEAATKSASDPQFRKVQLSAYKLIGYTRASDELLDDSAISLADFLASPLGMAGGIAWMEDYAFLRGSGAGQPLGVINAGATITVNRAATVPAVGYADLVNMLESFLPTGRGVWVINQSLMSVLMQMQDQGGGAANTGGYIWGSAADGVPGRLLGLPVIFTEKTPTSGTAGDILLADFNYYLIGDRQATTVESTQFDYWRYDQTSWRAVHRVDGQPWLSAPLTLADGTLQVSPFVILGDKST